MKAKLLDQAFILLDREGPDGVTIRAVARAAGVSHAAPANHFADLKQLLTEMALLIFEDYLDQVNAHADKDAKGRARAYMTSLYEFSQSNPSRYDLLWRKDLVDWDSAPFCQRLEEAYRDFIAALSSASEKSNGKVSDLETLGTALWSMIHGFAVLRTTGIFESRTDAVTGRPRVDAMLDLLLGAPSYRNGSANTAPVRS